MNDPKLVAHVTDAANSANVTISHMATILSLFLLRQSANGNGVIGQAILRGLSDEIADIGSDVT